jgi:hypothetical protein
MDYDDLIGVNTVRDIREGDHIIVINDKSDHNHKTYTVKKVFKDDRLNKYEIKEVNISFCENEIRIWEAKDQRIRENLYKVSKILRDNQSEDMSVFFHPETPEKLEKVLKEHREFLQKAYDDFIEKRIFTERTIKKLNAIYKENIELQKKIKDKIKEKKS